MRETSADLIDHLLDDGYAVYWHNAPICEPENFFANPVHHWALRDIASLMMLCIPAERDADGAIPLPRVTHRYERWS